MTHDSCAHNLSLVQFSSPPNTEQEKNMNSKKVGAVALSAVALVVLVSGCAGVRSQVEAGSGQSSITSLSQQAQTQHREAAEARARQHAVPLDASKLAANEAIRSDKQTATKSAVTPNRVQEAIQADKQASSRMSASVAQGLRLTQQAEAYRAAVEQHALEQTAPEELRATPPTEGAQDTLTDEERAAQHPQQEQR
jgi:uncharacterized protein YceK